jgi:hypothetical protein
MQLAKNIGFYVGFIAASALFLIVEHFTHIEFFFHVAAIPLEVLVAVFIVEKMLERRETKERRRQLMFIKSHMFRTDMRGLFIANFRGLKKPAITMSQIREASLEDLRKMRHEAEAIEYRSPEAMEEIIREYVKAQPVWTSFMERAITYNFENIFLDMIYQGEESPERRDSEVSGLRHRAQGKTAQGLRRPDDRLRDLRPDASSPILKGDRAQEAT